MGFHFLDSLYCVISMVLYDGVKMKLMVAGDDYIAALGGIESSIRHTLQSSLENYNH